MDDARADGDAFTAIDPKLTVFALANGVDLAKGERYRRLEWFADGFERGILLATDGSGSYRVSVLKWKSGSAEEASPEPFRDGVAAGDVTGILDDAIEAANAL